MLGFECGFTLGGPAGIVRMGKVRCVLSCSGGAAFPVYFGGSALHPPPVSKNNSFLPLKTVCVDFCVSEFSHPHL